MHPRLTIRPKGKSAFFKEQRDLIATNMSLESLRTALGPLLTEFLAPLKDDLATMKGDISAMKGDISAMKDDILTMKGDILTMKDDISSLRTAVVRADCARAVDSARLANRLKSLTARLVALPFDCNGELWPQTVDQPTRMIDLAISGSEHVPGERRVSGWNRLKSRAFLAKAVSGYDATSGSDGEGEEGSKARTARLKVIEAMGGSYERVIGSNNTLN